MQVDSLFSASPSPLRARKVMELLDATFHIYRENFAAFITIAALVIIPTSIASAFVSFTSASSTAMGSSARMSSEQVGQFTGVFCLGSLVALVLTLVQATVLNGVSTYITSERQFGRRLTLGEAWAGASGRLGTLALGYILFYCVLLALGLVVGLGTALCFPLMALFAIVIYFAVTIGAFIAPVAILEQIRASGAVTRAHMLAKQRFWQVLGLGGLIFLITFVISIAFSSLATYLLLSDQRMQFTLTGQVLNTAVTALVNIIVAPILPIAMTLLYYDTRVRVEGLDLQLQALGPDARPDQIVVPKSPEGLLNTKDFTNMAIMVGVVLALTLVLGGAMVGIMNIIAPDFFRNFNPPR